nr:hypothetical protein [Rhizobium sp. ACO-34A]
MFVDEDKIVAPTLFQRILDRTLMKFAALLACAALLIGLAVTA